MLSPFLAGPREALYPPRRGTATLPQPTNDERRIERRYLRYAGVGLQFGVTIAIFVWVGVWLDERFGTSPLFTIGLALLGFVGAMASLIYRVQAEERDDR